MATKAVHIRIDAKQKKQLEELFAHIGLDIPTAVRIFFRRVQITGEIPFPLSVEHGIDYYTPDQLKKLDKLAEEAWQEKNIAASFQLPKDSKKMSQWLLQG